ncbi:hypothetical protein Gpo141_00003871 [Globisporangium polare]
MLGVVNATLDTMRLKTLYVRGHVSDTTTVLVTLASPSIEEDPWQSFAVKWVENGQPSQLHSLLRIGYHFLRSVHFPQTHEVQPFVRGSLSSCGLYAERACRPGVVEVFAKGVVDPVGHILRVVAIRASANVLVSTWHNLDCALPKKLAWRLQQQQQRKKK